jgi:C2 domain-containing protein/WH2 motif-containing protein
MARRHPIELYIEMVGDLPDCDSGKRDLTDAYVIIRCGGQEYKTQTIRDNLDPYFRQTFHIDTEHFIDFLIYDKDKYTRDDLIGNIRINEPNTDNELHNYILRDKRGNVVLGEAVDENGNQRESYIRLRFSNIGVADPVRTILNPVRTVPIPIPDPIADVPYVPSNTNIGVTSTTGFDTDAMRMRRAARRRRVQAKNSRNLPPLPGSNDPSTSTVPPPMAIPPIPPPAPVSTMNAPVRPTSSTDRGGLFAAIQKGKKLKKAEDREIGPPVVPKGGSSQAPNLMGDLMKAMDTRRHAIDDLNDADQGSTGSGLVFGDLQDSDDKWAV